MRQAGCKPGQKRGYVEDAKKRQVNYQNWNRSAKPYDALPCGLCIAQHVNGVHAIHAVSGPDGFMTLGCCNPEHNAITIAAVEKKISAVWDKETGQYVTTGTPQAFVAIRKKFAHLWR